MFNVQCKHGEGIRIGKSVVIADLVRCGRPDRVMLRVEAPQEVRIDILKNGDSGIPRKIHEVLTE